jgi:hypothetical protein
MKYIVKSKDVKYFREKLLDFLKNKYLKDDGFLKKSKSYPVGTVRTWDGRKYKKLNSGKWMLYYESSSGRGVTQALRNTIKRIESAKTIEELVEIVKDNKDRFKDEKGRMSSVVNELFQASRKTDVGKKKHKEDKYTYKEPLNNNKELAEQKNNKKYIEKETLRDDLRKIFKGAGMGDHNDDISDAVHSLAKNVTKMMRNEITFDEAKNKIHSDLIAISTMVKVQSRPRKNYKGNTILPYPYIVDFKNEKINMIESVIDKLTDDIKDNKQEIL